MYAKDYRHLRTLTDKIFDEIKNRHPREFKCGLGCHSCCIPGLTVGEKEKQEIQHYLLQNPKQLMAAKKIDADNPHNNSRCAFLDHKGDCTIYSVRPITCRSHGAPLAIAKENHFQIDSCALNFTTTPIETLPQDDFFILDDLHGWVGFFNQSDRRWPLTIDGIMNKEKIP